jgi:hypothetical protein
MLLHRICWRLVAALCGFVEILMIRGVLLPLALRRTLLLRASALVALFVNHARRACNTQTKARPAINSMER